MDFATLQNKIKSGQIAPVYFLYGEEPYFIDKITQNLEQSVLQGAEPSFNLDVIYGPDVNIQELLARLRAYPVMANYRLVIVKESQRMRKEQFEKLAGYINNPVPSTVLVLLYNTKQKPDGRTQFGKLLATKSTMFESKQLYERQVLKWVESYLKDRNYQIKPDALQVLVSSLGTNLLLIENEIKRILLNIQSKNTQLIDYELICDLVSIDKDFNVFELLNQTGARNAVQCQLIIDQMMKNPTENAPIMIISQLFSFFSKLALLKQHRAETEEAVVKQLGINPYFANQYLTALKNFSFDRIQGNLKYLLEADLALKGIITTRMDETHIMKTLFFRLLQH